MFFSNQTFLGVNAPGSRIASAEDIRQECRACEPSERISKHGDQPLSVATVTCPAESACRCF